eukprot:1247431-Pyramimonas_sp.AAC.1
MEGGEKDMRRGCQREELVRLTLIDPCSVCRAPFAVAGRAAGHGATRGGGGAGRGRRRRRREKRRR